MERDEIENRSGVISPIHWQHTIALILAEIADRQRKCYPHVWKYAGGGGVPGDDTVLEIKQCEHCYAMKVTVHRLTSQQCELDEVADETELGHS